MRKLLSNFIHKLVFRCESLSKMPYKEDLGAVDKLRARAHFMICKACQRYKCQMDMISDTYKESCREREDTCLDQERLSQVENDVINKICKK